MMPRHPTSQPRLQNQQKPTSPRVDYQLINTTSGRECLLQQRNRDGKHGSLSLARTFCAHRTPVELDDVAHKRQTQSEACLRLSAGFVRLAEQLENVRHELGTDTLARITHRNLCVGVDTL